MASDAGRPSFKQPRAATVYGSPEELFTKLSGRAPTHGYLRGPQQDVLREYAERATTAADVAFELPTGTGKTSVGLLAAEWKRGAGGRPVFLSLTNQLAGQVLAEGKRLNVPCADLRGTKDTRDPGEEGRYRTGAAIGVTTYSNLFNVNPVIKDPEVIVCDDAHGAERYVADMWTVTVPAKDGALYSTLLAALRPGLSESQLRAVLDKSSVLGVEMPDVHGHPECLAALATALDAAVADPARFGWRMIKNRLRSCLFLVSPHEVTIRPLVPPTHTHAPFANARQRIYMSATLGGESDLQRAYGIQKIEMIRAKSTQWGRRYVFVPGTYRDEAEAEQVVASVWDSMRTRRAVLLAPSDRTLQKTYSALEGRMTTRPTRMGAQDVADTIDGFTSSTNAILALAGRYDGLDLPDDQCRLLIMAESPAAVNPLERHLIERWKMGPVLRRRERTRLIQGMGRCTRSPTDFAVIIWLGQSLVHAATSPALLQGLPAELAAEIRWGIEQCSSDPAALVAMVLGLLDDPEYRKMADAGIQGIQANQPKPQLKDYEEAGADEVRYAKAMWDENFGHAFRVAREIADRLTSPDLSGYRAWWEYLSSAAAALAGDRATEQECLRRGSQCGVNAGWLNRLLHHRGTVIPEEKGRGIEPNAEELWDTLNAWGWQGPTFEKQLGLMLSRLNATAHVDYHQGLESLGRCFGARTTRRTDPGVPDVVWSFPTDFHIAFEAKTEKKAGAALSKGDIAEARGHADWVKDKLCQDPARAQVATVVVAPSPALHQVALPFAGDLYYIAPPRLLDIAGRVAEGVRRIRLTYAGREFPEVALPFSADMRSAGLDIESLRKLLLSEQLKK